MGVVRNYNLLLYSDLFCCNKQLLSHLSDLIFVSREGGNYLLHFTDKESEAKEDPMTT